ncbi:MAG: VanZ family protein [Anaerolineaceae bacterium]|nr:VanZ family protein [Anaerolineaceae bacterium]
MRGWVFAKRSSWAARWLPLLIAMGVIFFVSNQPSYDLPSFGLWDLTVKKAGHFVAYAGLALLALRAVWGGKRPYLAAILIVFLYSVSDEFHQTFIPGRNGTPVDVAIDMFGAFTCLWLIYWRQWTPQPQLLAKEPSLKQ